MTAVRRTRTSRWYHDPVRPLDDRGRFVSRGFRWPRTTRPTTEPATRRWPPAYRAAEVEPEIYERWLAADVFAPDGSGQSRADDSEAAVRHHPAAAQRDRRAAHRPRPDRVGRGRDDPSRADAGPPDAVAARRRPRVDRRPGRARPDHRRGGRDRASRSVASATSSGCGSSSTRRATSSPSQQRRLGVSADWSRLRFTMDEGSARGGARRLQAAVRRRPRLSRRAAHQLVPGLPDQPVGPRGDRRRPRPGRSGPSDTTSSRRRHARSRTRRSPSPRRGPRRSSATPPWPSIRTIARYAALVGRQVLIPFVDRVVPDHRRRRRRAASSARARSRSRRPTTTTTSRPAGVTACRSST